VRVSDDFKDVDLSAHSFDVSSGVDLAFLQDFYGDLLSGQAMSS
jgi:hypothetical protein